MLSELRQRLLRTPLFYKILLANVAIVAFGAVAGTVITVWHVLTYPEDVHFELIAFFAVSGLVISYVVNNWVLKRALDPLDRLQRAVDAVRSGRASVRVVPGDNSDERFDRLAETFNQMLERLEHDTLALQQLSRQILQAQEAERQRLARELHDEAAQALTSLLVHLRLLERAHSPEAAQQHVQELRELTAGALENVRRVALDLRPTILDDLGLGPALEWCVDEINKAGTVHASITISGIVHRLPRETELVLYRVGQEALANVSRHAHASQVHASLQVNDGNVILIVEDDGIGFDPDHMQPSAGHGLGLAGMRERVAMLGGHVEVASQPGAGTRIVARVPAPLEMAA
ncbi:MAG: HAMP domain-containing protein [Caldilineaceae bacterium]|nr:HAMP domain-containing protein [Caldilineaceae bacterium]